MDANFEGQSFTELSDEQAAIGHYRVSNKHQDFSAAGKASFHCIRPLRPSFVVSPNEAQW